MPQMQSLTRRLRSHTKGIYVLFDKPNRPIQGQGNFFWGRHKNRGNPECVERKVFVGMLRNQEEEKANV